MPTDIIYSDDGNRLTYFSKSKPGISVTVSRYGIVEAAFLAQSWHGGQWSGLYALQCGSFDYETIHRAGSEFSAALRAVRETPERYDDDEEDKLRAAIQILGSVTHPQFGED